MDNKQPISVGLYYQKVYVHYKDGTDETIEFDNIKDAFEKYSDISSQIPPQITDQQYTAVVAQNKSLQGELRLANRIIDSMAETLAVDDDCNNWNEVITCQPETIPCEECIKKYYKQQALQELEAENGLY